MKNVKEFARTNLAWILLIIICIVFSFFSENFFSTRNLLNILNQNAYIIIAAYGISFIMMSGNMDISLGYQMSITGVISALLLTKFGLPTIVVVLIAIGIGILLSVVNTLLSIKLSIPRMFVSFGTMTIYQGLAYVISQSKSISGFTDSFKYIGQGTLFNSNFTFAILMMIVLGAVVSFVLNKTYFGRYVFALGGNKDAARLAGINVKKMEIYIGIIAGAFCGLASVVLISRVGTATAATAVGTEFSVITGLLLGGVSIRGGEGKINGCIAGILIIGILGNGMQLAGMNVYYQFVAKGAIMLATIAFDTYQMKRRSIEKNVRKEGEVDGKISLSKNIKYSN